MKIKYYEKCKWCGIIESFHIHKNSERVYYKFVFPRGM